MVFLFSILTKFSPFLFPQELHLYCRWTKERARTVTTKKQRKTEEAILEGLGESLEDIQEIRTLLASYDTIPIKLETALLGFLDKLESKLGDEEQSTQR